MQQVVKRLFNKSVSQVALQQQQQQHYRRHDSCFSRFYPYSHTEEEKKNRIILPSVILLRLSSISHPK